MTKLIALILLLSACAWAGPQILDRPELTDKKRGRKVPIKVYLPEEGNPKALVLISHQAGGNRDSHESLAKYLSNRRYVVFSVEHQKSKDSNAALSDRARDISFAIDQAEDWHCNDPILTGHLDLHRIGVIGFGEGAFAALTTCGAQPSGFRQSFVDERVDCGIAVAPSWKPGELFSEDGYEAVAKPFICLSGVGGPSNRDNSAALSQACFQAMPPGDKHLICISWADLMSSSSYPADVSHAAWHISEGLLREYLYNWGMLRTQEHRNRQASECIRGQVQKIYWKAK